jgi:hypothetical protein
MDLHPDTHDSLLPNCASCGKGSRAGCDVPSPPDRCQQLISPAIGDSMLVSSATITTAAVLARARHREPPRSRVPAASTHPNAAGRATVNDARPAGSSVHSATAAQAAGRPCPRYPMPGLQPLHQGCGERGRGRHRRSRAERREQVGGQQQAAGRIEAAVPGEQVPGLGYRPAHPARVSAAGRSVPTRGRPISHTGRPPPWRREPEARIGADSCPGGGWLVRGGPVRWARSRGATTAGWRTWWFW